MTQHLRNLPREARDTLLLLSVIALVLTPHLPYLPLWCSATAALVLGWRALVAWHNIAPPSRWWLIGLLALVLAGTWLEHRSLVGQQAGVTLLVLLLTLKTLELRARRDAYVVFFLSFFTILTAFFQSQSLGTAALVMLAFFGLMMALINANLTANTPSLGVLAKLASQLVLLGLPLMLVLFMLFPRMAPLWGMPNQNPQGKTGLSDNMEVGSMAELALDETIAFRLRFDGAPPQAKDMYFRGPVLDHFDGRNWKAQLSEFSFMTLADLNLKPTGISSSYEVTMEPNQRPWIFALEATNQVPALPPPYRARLNGQLQWITNQPITRVIRYQAQSTPNFTYAPQRDARLLQHFLSLPEGFDPRTHALAKSMRAQLPGATAQLFAEQALQRLRTGGYLYSLDPGIYPENTADHFWFESKVGFCEHIASAFVVLMRAAGYPSRIVTGYQGAELNGMDGYWVVRQANAHAWAEIWDDTLGWIRVDPTGAVMPGRIGSFERLSTSTTNNMLNTLDPSFLASLRHLWDAMDNAWTQRVLNYSQGEQLKLLEKLGFRSPTWLDMVRVLLAVLIAGSIFLLLLAWLKRSKQDPWIRLLGQAQQVWLASEKADHALITPRRLADKVSTSLEPEEIKVLWRHWLAEMERWRYAPHARAVSLSALQRQLKQLPRPAHRSAPAPELTP